jgi:hypothetical protein
MGLLDGPMRQLADVLIGTLGGTVSLLKPGVDFDPVTDSNASANAPRWDHVPAEPFASFKVDEAYDTFRAAGSTIEQGDFSTGIAAKYLSDNNIPPPEVGWRIVKDSVHYRIKGVAPEYAGDEVAKYTLHCGRF